MIHKWKSEELDDLYDNYSYYINHKDEAKKLYDCSWNAIAKQASILSCNKQKKSNKNILDSARSYIDGLILSDFSVLCKTTFSGYLSASCKYKEWLLNVSEDLLPYNILSYVNDGKYYNSTFGYYFIYGFNTLIYTEFKDMRDRWYKPYYYEDKDGYENMCYKKIVPKDIVLTPYFIMNEYLGDGTSDGIDCVQFATMGFDIDDIYFLSDTINNYLGITSNVSKDKRISISNNKDLIIFFDYINECKYPSCYSYKFKIKDRLCREKS